MKTKFLPAGQRGHMDHGWLKTWHSFSFASYYNPEKVHFGALRVLNHDIIDGNTGFGRHPHDNMEIITIMLRGALEHKDSMGHTQIIGKDEVQVMSAGSGIQHSEYNASNTEEAELYQIWIFPDKKDLTPRYDQKRIIVGDNSIVKIVGQIDNGAPLYIHQNAEIFKGKISEGSSLNHLPSNPAYLINTSGSIKIGEHELNEKDALEIYSTEEFEITGNKNSEFLIIEVPETW